MYFIGDRVVQLRVSRGMTQQQFAERIGYSRSYLRDIETGKVGASQRFVQAVIEKFGVTLGWLNESRLEDWISESVLNAAESDEHFFIVLYVFNQAEMGIGEEKLAEYLRSFDHVAIDASQIGTQSGLLSALMGTDYKGKGIFTRYRDYCDQKEFFYVLIKNLSQSKIVNPYEMLSRLVKSSKNHMVILLDKGSFLEQMPNSLYMDAMLKHVSYEDFLD